MAAPRKGRPKKINSQAEQLVKALNFVALASEDDETLISSGHVKLGDNMAIVFSRLISAGHPIAEDLKICPHLGRLNLALNKSGKTLTITETPGGALSISGDKFRAVIPSIGLDDMPDIQPDPPVAVVNDTIKQAFKVCGTMASEAGERVIEASLLLEAYICTGTNGVAMIQFAHGHDLPPHMVISKAFAAAVLKVETPLTGFGFTWNEELGKPSSVTFWFEGGSWLRGSCYSDRWPDIEPIVGAAAFPIDIPAGLFEAIEAVEKFSDDKEPSVYFADGKVLSHPTPEAGAQYDVAGLPAGKRFKAKLMRQVAPFAKAIDLTTHPDRAFFVGEHEGGMIRGVIMGMSGAIPPTPAQPTETTPEPEIAGDYQDDAEPEMQPWGAADPNTGWNT